MFSEAPIKQNSFKTAFERCCRRLVEFDIRLFQKRAWAAPGTTLEQKSYKNVA